MVLIRFFSLPLLSNLSVLPTYVYYLVTHVHKNKFNRITNDAREDEMEENMGQVNTMIGELFDVLYVIIVLSFVTIYISICFSFMSM